jgi:hypothetical protein
MNRRGFLSLTSSLAAHSIAAAEDTTGITFTEEDSRILFRHGRKPICRYQAQPGPLPAGVDPSFTRGGYLTDLHTPLGHLITDDFPPDHLHHHGVWSAWTKCRWQGRDTDFWNMGQKKGRVDFKAHTKPQHNGPAATLSAQHVYTDLTSGQPLPVLAETWDLTVAILPSTSLPGISLTITQKVIASEPLELPKYHYGGLGFRGHRSWKGTKGCRFLTSEGITDRIKGNESRARWCWVGGITNGSLCGALLASHPQNPIHPEPVRLNPTEPFFCFAPPQAGDRSLAPDSLSHSRYLIVPLDGEPASASCDAIARAWANTP